MWWNGERHDQDVLTAALDHHGHGRPLLPSPSASGPGLSQYRLFFGGQVVRRWNLITTTATNWPVYRLIAPSPEFCDGLDNDCNACIDDNPLDAWIGTACSW
jgi:hypothetical protein